MDAQLQGLAKKAKTVFEKYPVVRKAQIVLPSPYEDPPVLIFMAEYTAKIGRYDYTNLQFDLSAAFPEVKLAYLGSDHEKILAGATELGDRRFQHVEIYPDYKSPEVVSDLRDDVADE